MDKIQGYIAQFLKRVKISNKYDMRGEEWIALSNKAMERPVDAIGITFNYGYAKGYRAAMAEMKKGGPA